MTKKDYELVAGAIASVEAITEDGLDINGVGASTLRLVVNQLGAAIKVVSPRFNAGRFETAALPIQSERRKQAILTTLAKQS
jgi:hypothetical protein